MHHSNGNFLVYNIDTGVFLCAVRSYHRVCAGAQLWQIGAGSTDFGLDGSFSTAQLCNSPLYQLAAHPNGNIFMWYTDQGAKLMRMICPNQPTIAPTPSWTSCGCGLPGQIFDRKLGTCRNCGNSGFVANTSFTCSVCTPGRWFPGETCQNSYFTTACFGCAAGSYSADYQTANCLDCTTGRYSSGPTNTACFLCAKGSFSPSSAQCSVCPAGKINAVDGQPSCSSCALAFNPGSYVNITGQTACKICPAGSSTFGDPSHCLPCIRGSFSAQPASACTLCAAGHFSVAVGAPTGSVCQPCQATT